ncbi:MAG: DUF692 family protein [Planctomycetes bacterium]|nr:DUF692 family protein [Planctomycetota bacterium]
MLVARRAIEELADFYEISPELHWIDPKTPSDARAQLLDLVIRSGKPVTGHGLFNSLGSEDDLPRREALEALVERDAREFGFRHYSEHLGFTADRGAEAVLPLPLPMGEATAQLVASNLRRLRSRLGPGGRVAFENSAFLTPLGDPTLEPEFLGRICELADCGLVLDLHNAHCNCVNANMSLDDWLGRVPWERVVEIHLSGGSWSDPAWLESGERRLLDTHDDVVPEPVWEACEQALAWAPSLGGIVLEWLGLREDQAPAHEADLIRARQLWASRPRAAAPPRRTPRDLLPQPTPALAREVLLGAVLADDSPHALSEDLDRRADSLLREAFAGIDEEGLRLTTLIVKRLRCERILLGDGRCRVDFEADPRDFTERFRSYDRLSPSSTPWPAGESVAFASYCDGLGAGS